MSKGAGASKPTRASSASLGPSKAGRYYPVKWLDYL
jgi:hypothetical protein